MAYFNNYLRGPKRPSLPEYPSAKPVAAASSRGDAPGLGSASGGPQASYHGGSGGFQGGGGAGGFSSGNSERGGYNSYRGGAGAMAYGTKTAHTYTHVYIVTHYVFQ